MHSTKKNIDNKKIYHLTKFLFRFLVVLFSAGFSANNLMAQKPIWIEAEDFKNPGGWVIDQQSIDQIGSSYLLAHGIGVPCKNAVTEVGFQKTGRYHVWVRTRNWAAAPVRSQSAGRFTLEINGQVLDSIFGQDKPEWNWHYGGAVEIQKLKTEVSLHDLTGFDGRCDAIVFSTNKDLISHQSEETLLGWRKKAVCFPKAPGKSGQFDLVVVGGGVAGITASVSAARLGMKVALIHNRPVPGGNNSSEIGVPMVSDLNIAPYPNLGNLTRQLDEYNNTLDQKLEIKSDQAKLDFILNEPNITFFPEMHVIRAKVTNGKIRSITAQNIRSNREELISGKLFADCTGDGNLGFLAGADSRYGRESKNETGESLAPEKSDSLVLGASLFWNTVDRQQPVSFPECPWALSFSAQSCQQAFGGAWNWETGFQYDMVNRVEFIRDNMLRAIYGNWSFQKNNPQFREKYKNYSLDGVGYVLGKRESRRLMGDVVYSQTDIDDGLEYPDACVSSRWGIDLHYPDPKNSKFFEGNEFRSVSTHTLKNVHPIRTLPLRCLYSRNIDNLFIAGRCASMTHIAHGMFRCQHTTGMMGEVVGMAAWLCMRNNTIPREIYLKHLGEMKKLLAKGIQRKQSIK